MDKYLGFCLEVDTECGCSLYSFDDEDLMISIKEGYDTDKEFKQALKKQYHNDKFCMYEELNNEWVYCLKNTLTSAEYDDDEKIVRLIDKTGKEYKIYSNGVLPNANNKAVKEMLDCIEYFNENADKKFLLKEIPDNEIYMEKL